MPLLASPLGGFMPILILFIVLIGFTVWQGKRQVKKQQEERAKLESNLQEGRRRARPWRRSQRPQAGHRTTCW